MSPHDPRLDETEGLLLEAASQIERAAALVSRAAEKLNTDRETRPRAAQLEDLTLSVQECANLAADHAADIQCGMATETRGA